MLYIRPAFLTNTNAKLNAMPPSRRNFLSSTLGLTAIGTVLSVPVPETSGWMFIAAGTAASGIALLTVGFQSMRAAMANPGTPVNDSRDGLF